MKDASIEAADHSRYIAVIRKFPEVEGLKVLVDNLQEQRLLGEVDAHTGDADLLAFSPEGRILVSAIVDGESIYTQISTMRQVAMAQVPAMEGNDHLTPDSKTLLGVRDTGHREDCSPVVFMEILEKNVFCTTDSWGVRNGGPSVTLCVTNLRFRCTTSRFFPVVTC